MICPMCGSKNLETHDWLIYYSDGNDYKCLECGCEFGIFNDGAESE